MEKTPRFLRFSGALREDMDFTREPGWETENVAHRPEEGDGEYRLELRNKKGELLVETSPRVDFTNICLPTDTKVRTTRVIAYVPLHKDACEMTFRRRDMILFREEIAKEPPKIRIDAVDLQKDGKVKVSWTASASGRGRTLWFKVVYIVDKTRSFVVANRLRRRSYAADLKSLPGSRQARFGVLATDGVRSAFAVSKAFEVVAKSPQIWIQSPDPEVTLPADQPVSLCGQALDVAGASLPEDGLVWRLDDEEVARGKRLGIATAPEPGQHKLSLTYEVKGKPQAEATVIVQIADRGPEQERFRALIEKGRGGRER